MSKYSMRFDGEEAPPKPTYTMERWGKDHWSTFSYIETMCVDYPDGIGKLDHRRIQTNLDRHPGMANLNYVSRDDVDGASHSIRLAGGIEIPGPNYDDWDCIDDMIGEGLIKNVGTGTNPAYVMLPRGNVVAAQLRAWKAQGGRFATFKFHDEVEAKC